MCVWLDVWMGGRRHVSNDVLIPSVRQVMKSCGRRVSLRNTTYKEKIYMHKLWGRTILIHQLQGSTPMLKKREASQLRWLRHLERIPKEGVAKKRWKWICEGTTARGRPREMWKDGVEILRKHNLPDILELKETGKFC